jgi:tyrosyl-DNA phosphodiesterase 1
VTATLIPSIAGKHEGWPKVVKTGHTALMRAVRLIAGINDKKARNGYIECQVGVFVVKRMDH